MKKIVSMFLLIVMVMTFAACSNQNQESKVILTSVLDSQKTFIDEDGNAVLLRDYVIGNDFLVDELLANPTEYVFVDFNEDNVDEMVVNISENLGFYLVLYWNGFDVYGYGYGVRALACLKTDGSFIASSGADSNCYCRLTFENNKPKVIYDAIKDSPINRYELAGNSCSIEEVDAYIRSWNSKKDVVWIKYESAENVSAKGTEDTTSNVEPINLNDYISLSFSGKNLAGYASVTFDKEKFLLDHIENVSFNKENIQVYRELYGNTDKSAANTIVNYISVDLDHETRLTNGDVVNISWNIDTEKIENYFECDYVCSSEAFEVTGLPEADSFDPFAKLDVSFSGVSPNGYVKAHIEGTYFGSYVAEPKEGLKNGDIVTVTYECEDKATMIAKWGEYPSCYEKTYIVKGLE